MLAATGGHLTMLSEAGGNFYAAGAQMDTFAQVAEADAGLLAKVFQHDFDAPILEEFFPGHPVSAYFTFRPAATRDPSQIVNTALLLAGMGYRIDAAQISERIGMKVESAQMPAMERFSHGGTGARGYENETANEAGGQAP